MSLASSNSVNETGVLYEISLAIGSSLDLKTMLKSALSKMLRGLNCNAALVYSFSQHENQLSWQHEVVLPRNAESSSNVQNILRALQLPSDINAFDDFATRVESIISDSESQHYYAFLLDGFGFLLLKKSGKAFSFNLHKSLQKVMPKLAHACKACLHEQDLRKQMVAAQAANVAKSQFLARMSHEIRTPMNGILGMLEIVLESDLNDEQKENLQLAEQSASHLLQIINDILDLSRIEAGKLTITPSATDLHHLVHSTVRAFLPRAQEINLALSYRIEENVPQYVQVDASRLRQVLTNLLGNAIKFTPSGKVELTLQLMVNSRQQTMLSFSVIDSGIGIAPDKLENMFNPFEQADSGTNRQYEGTGLGLAICKEIMQSMHGDITATSELNKGSVFHFQLPLISCSEQEVEAVVSSKRVSSEASRSAQNLDFTASDLSVLVVDDKPINYKIASKFLQSFGCQTTPASNGVEAIDKVKAQHFDVIFMDVMMPEMDGFTATKEIRQLEQAGCIAKQTIIAMTANAMQGDREACVAAGMDGYIAKPINKQQMRAELGAVLGARLGASSEQTPPRENSEPIDTALSTTTDSLAHEDVVTETPIDGHCYIDWQRALLYLDNDKNLLKSLVSIYCTEGPEYIQTLKTATQQHDTKQVKLTAHTIKTMAASFFCEQVRQLAFEVEQSAINGKIDPNLIARLVAELELLIATLQQSK